MPHLENWLQLPNKSLLGEVSGDPRYDPKTTAFQDGHRVVTSVVVEMGVGWAVTESGTKYTLGKKFQKEGK